MSEPKIGRRTKVALYMNYVLDKRLAGLAEGLYRLTNGRITQLWKVDVLILTTRGRRSGKTRTVLLQFFREGTNRILVAANSGRNAHPGWFYNLQANPIAQIQVMNRIMQVRTEVLSTEEATAFWPQVLRKAPTYIRYQQATNRTIPFVRLVPVDALEE
jgi:F420H(2)-dependent quinone reductase